MELDVGRNVRLLAGVVGSPDAVAKMLRRRPPLITASDATLQARRAHTRLLFHLCCLTTKARCESLVASAFLRACSWQSTEALHKRMIAYSSLSAAVAAAVATLVSCRPYMPLSNLRMLKTAARITAMCALHCTARTAAARGRPDAHLAAPARAGEDHARLCEARPDAAGARTRPRRRAWHPRAPARLRRRAAHPHAPPRQRGACPPRCRPLSCGVLLSGNFGALMPHRCRA